MLETSRATTHDAPDPVRRLAPRPAPPDGLRRWRRRRHHDHRPGRLVADRHVHRARKGVRGPAPGRHREVRVRLVRHAGPAGDPGGSGRRAGDRGHHHHGQREVGSGRNAEDLRLQRPRARHSGGQPGSREHLRRPRQVVGEVRHVRADRPVRQGRPGSPRPGPHHRQAGQPGGRRQVGAGQADRGRGRRRSRLHDRRSGGRRPGEADRDPGQRPPGHDVPDRRTPAVQARGPGPGLRRPGPGSTGQQVLQKAGFGKP